MTKFLIRFHELLLQIYIFMHIFTINNIGIITFTVAFQHLEKNKLWLFNTKINSM